MIISTNKKSCKYCASLIPTNAKICKECDRYQSSFRTEIKYWSGVVGLFALVVSAFAFAAEIGGRAYREFWGEELAISDMSTTDVLRLWNLSSTDVWVKRIEWYANNKNYDLAVDTKYVLEPKKVVEIDITKLISEQSAGFHADIFTQKFGSYVEKLPEEEIDKFKANDRDIKKKYVPDFLYRDGPEYAHLKRFYNGEVFNFECKSLIIYSSVADTDNRVYEVPCVGVLRHTINETSSLSPWNNLGAQIICALANNLINCAERH